MMPIYQIRELRPQKFWVPAGDHAASKAWKSDAAPAPCSRTHALDLAACFPLIFPDCKELLLKIHSKRCFKKLFPWG